MMCAWNLARASIRHALSAIACVAVSGVAAANAQNAPNLQSPVTMSTNTKGVGIVVPPPAGFNALTASNSERALYAVPPEPDVTKVPYLHSVWRRAVSGLSNRQTQVEVKETNISNGPNRAVGGITQQANNTVGATSSNWSGTSIVSAGTPFKTEVIIGLFVVPTAHVPLGTCTGTEYYSSQWPGIDGNGSADVLQGGAEVDASCSGGTTTPFYSAWIEWFPFNEVRVGSPVIHPGDLLLVEVWSTSPTTGYVYFSDQSTGETAQYSLTAPSGTTLVGNSVEWIVERPGVGGTLANLTNYIDVPWSFGVAWNYQAANPIYHYMGRNPATLTLQEMTMVDNSNNPISVPTIENADFLWIQDTGSAY